MKISELIILAAKNFGGYNSTGATDDAKYDRAKIADWIDYYNLAQKQLVAVRPDSRYKHSSWALTANETRHTLPADCVQLISVDRNMGADGTTPGEPIRKINKKEIEALNLSWHSEAGRTYIEFYAYDQRTPNTMWSYQRAHATTAVHVEGSYSYHFTEAELASITTTDVAAADSFHNSLLNWMLKSAFATDDDSPRSTAMAQSYEQSFYNGLGIKFSSAQAIAPKE